MNTLHYTTINQTAITTGEHKNTAQIQISLFVHLFRIGHVNKIEKIIHPNTEFANVVSMFKNSVIIICK